MSRYLLACEGIQSQPHLVGLVDGLVDGCRRLSPFRWLHTLRPVEPVSERVGGEGIGWSGDRVGEGFFGVGGAGVVGEDGDVRVAATGEADVGAGSAGGRLEDADAAADDLARATSWLSDRNIPFWVIAPDSVASAVSDSAEPAGLDPAATTMPGMAYALADLPAEAIGDAEILAVTEPAQLGDFAIVASEAFGAPLEAAGTLAPASTLDEDRCSWFLGYLDGEVAACGQLLRTADVAGVYAIGVRERFRRRGLGAAITTAVLAAGRDSGCSIGVLQASPMGEPVYDRMGFETVTQYHRFVPSG